MVKYVLSRRQVADIMTKALGQELFKFHRNKLRVWEKSWAWVVVLEWSVKSARQAWQASSVKMIRWLGDSISTQEYSSGDKV